MDVCKSRHKEQDNNVKDVTWPIETSRSMFLKIAANPPPQADQGCLRKLKSEGGPSVRNIESLLNPGFSDEEQAKFVRGNNILTYEALVG